MKKANSVAIYGKEFRIHPKYPNYAFARNGDVVDMSQAPPKILNPVFKNRENGLVVNILNRLGNESTLRIANQMAYLYELLAWEKRNHYSVGYKDNDPRNIHLNNLKVIDKPRGDGRKKESKPSKQIDGNILKILELFDKKESFSGKKNVVFTFRKVNQRLPNYRICGVVEGCRYTKMTTGIESEIRKQVKLLNDNLFNN